MFFFQLKSTQAILQLLWDVSHLDSLPKHLVERALSEQLNILTDMPLVKNSNLINLNLVDLIHYYTIHMLKLIRFLIFVNWKQFKTLNLHFRTKIRTGSRTSIVVSKTSKLTEFVFCRPSTIWYVQFASF